MANIKVNTSLRLGAAGQMTATAGRDANGRAKVVMGGVEKTFARKRRMYPINLMNPTITGAAVQTLGTVTDTPAATETGHSVVRCLATGTGSTGRILKGFYPSHTLDTNKYYELSVTVTEATFASPNTMNQPWFGLTGTAAEGVAVLAMNGTKPVAGQRYSIRFKPSSADNVIRFGLGTNIAENVVAGDVLTGTDFSLYEIPTLTSQVVDYSYNSNGHVGMVSSDSASPASCVWAIGDSWSNDATDWPPVLGKAYGREIRVTATSGHLLTQMLTAANAALTSGSQWLLNPSKNVPGVAVILGGINDIVSDVAIVDLCSRVQALIDLARSRRMIPLFVMQPLATNSSWYTSGRATARANLLAYIMREGCDYIDLSAEGFLNADGTANSTYMLSESSVWVHPSSDGIALLVKLVENSLRSIDRSCVVLSEPTWP